MLLEINRLQTLINKLRQEIIDLTNERDILLIDVGEQRKAKNEVYKEFVLLLENISTLQKQIDIIAKTRQSSFNDFINEYGKQKEYLEDILNNKIDNEKQLEFLKKQKEEFDKQNINLISLKDEIIEQEKILNKTKQEQFLEKQELIKSKEELNKIIVKLKEEQEKITKEKESLILLRSEIQDNL